MIEPSLLLIQEDVNPRSLVVLVHVHVSKNLIVKAFVSVQTTLENKVYFERHLNFWNCGINMRFN